MCGCFQSMIYLFYERGMKSNLRPAYECLWGEMADAEGLFNVAELSKAKTYRENICRNTGRDSADHAPLGSGGVLPQLLQIKIEIFWLCICWSNMGMREKLLTYMWKLRLGDLLVSFSSLLKAMGLWGWQLKDGLTSFFPTGLHLCSSCPFPNSHPLSPLWSPSWGTTQRSEWNFSSCWSEGWQIMLKTLPGVFSGGFSEGKTPAKLYVRSQPTFQTLSPFAGNSGIYACPVSEMSPEQPGRLGHQSLKCCLEETSL